MAKQITVKADSPMDEMVKYNALVKINNYDKDTLNAITELLGTKQARTTFKANITTLKSYI